MYSDIDEIIIRYLDGSITVDEKEVLLGWLKTSEINRMHFRQMRDLWLKSSVQYAADNETETALARFREQVRLTESPGRRNLLRRRIPAYHLIWGVAASFLLAVGFMFFFNKEADISGIINNLCVSDGSKGRFVLPDSTVVWLNGGSSLRYEGDLSGNLREVTLQGEGYFEVTKNEHAPFVVDAGEIKVRVLGTRFNIDTYRQAGQICIALLQGAVEVIAAEGKVPLEVNDMAVYDTSTGKTIVVHNSAENTLYWVDNRLEFKGETFERIMEVLERNFDIRVKIFNEEIKAQRFAGDFVSNESIQQIFAVMAANGNFRYRFKDDTVEIY